VLGATYRFSRVIRRSTRSVEHYAQLLAVKPAILSYIYNRYTLTRISIFLMHKWLHVGDVIGVIPAQKQRSLI